MRQRWLVVLEVLVAACMAQPAAQHARVLVAGAVHVVPAPTAPEPAPPAAELANLPLAAASVPGVDAGLLASAGEPAPITAVDVLALQPGVSTSVGGPSSGKVLGSVALPELGPGFFHNSKRPADAGYGTVELVQAIVRAAAVVEQELPGSVLTVNDLGLREGGVIRQHGSHQAGRDADILFYVLDAHSKPLPSVGVPLDAAGKGWDFKDLSDPTDDQRVMLDAPRTWRFMQALLEVVDDSLQRIFLVEHLRTLLLAQADKVHAPKALRDRFAELTCQPDAPHDDHMHVRLFCSAEDIAAGCQDSPPIYPWHAQALKALDTKAVLASAYLHKAEHEAVAARTTSPAEARKRAGPMHARVLRFLQERKAWLNQPHPGRTYCR